MPETPRDAENAPALPALLVIDMQHSYFEDPRLAVQQEELLARNNELIRAARDNGRPVVLARTEHEPGRSTWTVKMHDDDQGFAFPGSRQAAFLEGLDEGEHVEIVKTRDSAFFGTDLVEQLHHLGVTHVLVSGVSTQSCIKETATDAFAHNFRTAIALDAVGSENQELAEAMLQFLTEEMRQPLLRQEQAMAFLADPESV